MIEREYIVNLYLIYKELLNEKEKKIADYYSQDNKSNIKDKSNNS